MTPHAARSRLPKVLVVLAVGWGLGCGPPAWKKRNDRKWARHMAPTEIPTEPSGAAAIPEGKVETIGLRIYAGPGYRAQVLRWTTKFARQVELANAILVPMVGCRLEIRKMEPWASESNPQDLGSMLEELETFDPGGDDWVIGLVTSLTRASSSFDDLGMARVGGRHMVLRNLSNLEEREAIVRLLPTMSDEERERLYVARRQHKETVVLLHELAHTLAVGHAEEPGWIMYGIYDREAHGFSPGSVARIQANLAERHEQARGVEEREASSATLAEVDRLLSTARQTTDDETALATLADAERRLAEIAGDHPQTWARLAVSYQQRNALTATERALNHSDHHPIAIARWVRQIRQRMAVPPDLVSVGLSLATEPRYVRELVAIRDLIAAERLSAAATAVERARGRFPRTPGVDVLACDLGIRRKKYAEARRACDRALARYADASWAHYLAALLDLRDRDRPAAVAHLRQALAVDPELTLASTQLRELGEKP